MPDHGEQRGRGTANGRQAAQQSKGEGIAAIIRQTGGAGAQTNELFFLGEEAPAITREAEENWGNKRWRYARRRAHLKLGLQTKGPGHHGQGRHWEEMLPLATIGTARQKPLARLGLICEKPM